MFPCINNELTGSLKIAGLAVSNHLFSEWTIGKNALLSSSPDNFNLHCRNTACVSIPTSSRHNFATSTFSEGNWIASCN